MSIKSQSKNIRVCNITCFFVFFSSYTQINTSKNKHTDTQNNVIYICFYKPTNMRLIVVGHKHYFFCHSCPLSLINKLIGAAHRRGLKNQKQETSDRTGHHQVPAANVLGAGQWKVSSTDQRH